MPPPVVALLSENVLLVTISVPLLLLPPPRPPPLVENVLLVTVSVPLLLLPPPLDAVPFVIVRFRSVRFAEGFTTSTCTSAEPLLSESPLSVIVPPPLIVSVP